MSHTTLAGRPAGTRAAVRPPSDPDEPVILLWSGRSPAEERAARSALLDALASPDPGPVLSRVPAGRPGGVRAAVVTSQRRAADDVAAATADRVDPAGPRPVALLLPGQGSQYAGMATGLYRCDPAFRATVDEVLGLWGAEGVAIRADWFSSRPAVGADDVRRAQPMLFAVDLALGRLVLRWGVRPAALLGHSAGEVVAATLAGVFTVREAVALVRDRIGASVAIPPGGMLAVAAPADELRSHLRGDVAIAAVNAVRQTMLAGPRDELAEVARRLDEAGYTARTVPATTPFHSPAMAPAVAEAARRFRACPRPASLDVWSGYTAARLCDDEAASPEFWASQIQDTVRFGPALSALLGTGDHLLLEAGPGQTLTAFARRQRAVARGGSAVLPMLPCGPGAAPAAERTAVLDVAAHLWRRGHDLTPGAL